MKRTLAIIFCLSLFVPRLATAEAETHAVTGVYLSNDEDHKIALFMHGAELRGKIVWTRESEGWRPSRRALWAHQVHPRGPIASRGWR